MLKEILKKLDQIFLVRAKVTNQTKWLVANGMLLEVPLDVKGAVSVRLITSEPNLWIQFTYDSSVGQLGVDFSSIDFEVAVCRFTKNIYISGMTDRVKESISIDFNYNGKQIYKESFDTAELKKRIYEICKING